MIKAYAAFEPKGELKPFEYDPGELQANEVEIDVHHCGICHSDLSVIDSEWGEMPYPIVPGHEVAGKITRVGSHVSALTVGQSVGLGWHAGYCNNCASCDSGDNNLCGSAQSTIIGHHGGFADKVRADAASVVAIPDGIDLSLAGPLFCAGVTVFTPLLEFNIKAGDKVAVIGIGGLGHLALQFLNAWGCEVTAFTSSEAKKQEALALGAHHTLDSRNAAEIGGAGASFDLIISTVNVKLDWGLYLSTLKPRGRLHFVGAVLEPLDINVFSLISSQLSVSGSAVGSPSTIKKMLAFVEQHNIKPVVESFSFDDVNAAIARVRSGKTHYRVVLSR
ncbi:NAD(P)-dependent alcohol dehydrogenase [Pseudomonadales bacterium]|nr:NAD(P)-dependent alcohol dehydrogenase [Pseudomonadales bacterium]